MQPSYLQETVLPPDHDRLPADQRNRRYCWDDPAVTAAAAREVAGKEFLEAIADGRLPAPPVARTLGFTLICVGTGNAAFEFAPAEFHYNPIGSVHGGVLSTLCDSACGCAVQSMLPAGTYYTSLDLSVKFLRPVTAAIGRMVCEGTVTHMGGRSALAAGAADRPERQAVRARDEQLHGVPPARRAEVAA